MNCRLKPEKRSENYPENNHIEPGLSVSVFQEKADYFKRIFYLCGKAFSKFLLDTKRDGIGKSIINMLARLADDNSEKEEFKITEEKNDDANFLSLLSSLIRDLDDLILKEFDPFVIETRIAQGLKDISGAQGVTIFKKHEDGDFLVPAVSINDQETQGRITVPHVPLFNEDGAAVIDHLSSYVFHRGVAINLSLEGGKEEFYLKGVEKFDKENSMKTGHVMAVPITRLDNGPESVAVVLFINPPDKEAFSDNLIELTKHMAKQAELFKENKQMIQKLLNIITDIESLQDGLDIQGHINRLYKYALHILNVIDDDPKKLSQVKKIVAESDIGVNVENEQEWDNYWKKFKKLFPIALRFHDLGKIFIPQVILQKPGKLTKEEFNIIKLHTILGDSVIRNIFGVRSLTEMILNIKNSHHNNIDETGYGLPSKNLEAYLAKLIDAFDGIASRRAYKDEFSIEQIEKEFDKDKKSFHPDILDWIFEEGFMESLLKIKEKENQKIEARQVSSEEAKALEKVMNWRKKWIDEQRKILSEVIKINQKTGQELTLLEILENYERECAFPN